MDAFRLMKNSEVGEHTLMELERRNFTGFTSLPLASDVSCADANAPGLNGDDGGQDGLDGDIVRFLRSIRVMRRHQARQRDADGPGRGDVEEGMAAGARVEAVHFTHLFTASEQSMASPPSMKVGHSLLPMAYAVAATPMM